MLLFSAVVFSFDIVRGSGDDDFFCPGTAKLPFPWADVADVGLLDVIMFWFSC